MTTLLSLPHAAVEAGLGTLGLNLQLLTPEYGPRVLLTAVLCSVDVDCDQPMSNALCLGPTCGALPQGLSRPTRSGIGAATGRPATATARRTASRSSPSTSTRIIAEPDAAKQKELLRSEDSFNLWQSILRGAGVITGCRRCADVCPVGADYEAMLRDALDAIPENTPAKEARARRHDSGRERRTRAGNLCRAAALDRPSLPPRQAPDVRGS